MHFQPHEKMALTFSTYTPISTYFSTVGYFRHPQSAGYLVRNGIITTSETHNHFFFVPTIDVY